MIHTQSNNGKFVAQGVVISPAFPAKGETVRLSYTGLLAGRADRVYVHFGFGTAWDKALEYRMTRTGAGFEAALPVAAEEPLNVCFRDTAGNWDNNSGENYSFEVFC